MKKLSSFYLIQFLTLSIFAWSDNDPGYLVLFEFMIENQAICVELTEDSLESIGRLRLFAQSSTSMHYHINGMQTMRTGQSQSHSLAIHRQSVSIVEPAPVRQRVFSLLANDYTCFYYGTNK